MTNYQHQEYVDEGAVRTEATVRSQRFSPGQVLGGVVGIVLTLIGILAVTRTGIDSNLNEPVTTVLGITHSAYVGLGEIVIGLLLLVSASSIAYRGVMGTLGGLLVIGGVVLAAANLRILLEVGAEHTTGWLMVVAGAIAVLGAMMPSIVRSSRVVETDVR